MYNFGNNPNDGHHARSYDYRPSWEKDVDYNPDHCPSSSAMHIMDREGDVVWLLQVRGIGVIMLRALDSRTFAGMSVFTKQEIGYSPNI